VATDISTAAPTSKTSKAGRRLPPELSILGVMIGMMLLFEVLGWIFVGQSFIANPLRLKIMILQEAEIGIIAVGVTQIIIMGGIDLSSGSVVGMTAMIAASLAQVAGYAHAIYPSLTGLNPIFPVAAGLACGMVAGLINGSLIALTKNPRLHRDARHDGFGAGRRGLVHERPTDREPFGWIRGHRRGLVASHHLPQRSALFSTSRCATPATESSHTRLAPIRSRRASPAINVERHMIAVYTIAGLLSGLSGIVHTARAISGQAGVGVGFELDAIAAAVIGGTSLSGGVGRMTGTVIGAVILGILTSGFTFLNVDAHYQEIIKGAVIIAAVVADQYRQRRRKSA